MSETTERAKELLANAAATDQQFVTIPALQLQLLVDQAEIHGAGNYAAVQQRMDEALERWAGTSARQIEAMNRVLDQNRLLQRRLAESQSGRPE